MEGRERPQAAKKIFLEGVSFRIVQRFGSWKGGGGKGKYKLSVKKIQRYLSIIINTIPPSLPIHQKMNFISRIKIFLQKIIPKPTNLPLGRWNRESCNNRINQKIDQSNEDHCGPCGKSIIPASVISLDKKDIK